MATATDKRTPVGVEGRRRQAGLIWFGILVMVGELVVWANTPSPEGIYGYRGTWVYLIPVLPGAGLTLAGFDILERRVGRSIVWVLLTIAVTWAAGVAAVLENMEW